MDWIELIQTNILVLSIGTGFLLAGILGWYVHKVFKSHMTGGDSRQDKQEQD